MTRVRTLASLSLASWCAALTFSVSAASPATGDRGERLRRALERGTLHVVQHAAESTHLFATACATRAPMNEPGHRRTMSGRLARTIAIDDQQSPMQRSEPKRELGRD